MKIYSILATLLFVTIAANAQNNPPTIEYFKAIETIGGPFTIEIQASDIENDPINVSIHYTIGDSDIFQQLDLSEHNVSYYPSEEFVPGVKNTWTIPNFELSEQITKMKLIVEDDQAFDIQSLVDQVDSNALRSNLELIEGPRNRNASLSHLGFCKDLIYTSYLENGLNARIQEYTYQGDIGQNLIGQKLATSKSDTTFIIDGHYDTVLFSPGADDNGSAIVGVMETVKILAPHHFEHNIEFIGFDMEEDGLIGSQMYLDRADGRDTTQYIGGVLNFEMIGYWDNTPNTQIFPNGFEVLFPEAEALVAANDFRGDFITNVGSTASTWLINAFNTSAEQFVPDLKVVPITTNISGLGAQDLRRSDHAYFWDAGYQALMLTDGANFRNPNYHTGNDKVETLNFTFMSNVVKATIATLAKIAKIKNASSEITEVVVYAITDGIENVFSNNVQIYKKDESAFISFKNPIEDSLNMQLLDLSGKVIANEKISANTKTHSLSLNDLSAGIYIINLSHKSSKFSEKITVD